MKPNILPSTPRRYWMMGVLLLASIFLSACGSSSETWPGVASDTETGTVIVSFNKTVTSLEGNRDRNWIYDYQSAKFFAPSLITDTTIYVGDFDGRFHAIDRASGEQKWLHAPEIQSFLFLNFRSNNRVIASAAIGGDRVFFGTERSVMAFDAEDGEVLWEFEDTEHSVWAKPLFVAGEAYDIEDTLFVAGLDKKLYAIEPDSGELRWSVELDGSVPGGMTLDVASGTIFLGTLNSTVYALSLEGDILAEYSAEGWVWEPPLFHEDTIYFGDLKGFIYGLTFAEGEFTEVWKTQVSEEALRGQPVVADGVLIVASEDKRVYAYNIDDVDSISKRWENDDFDKKFLSELAISQSDEDPVVIVATDDNERVLIALKIDDGKKVWEYEYKENGD